MNDRLAGIAQEMGFKGPQIQALDTASNSMDAAQIARMERDYKIFQTLRELKNLSGDNKAVYIQKTSEEAYKVVLRYKDDLAKINELRAKGTPEALAQAQEMFNSNPQLIDARAYLLIGAASAEAGFASNPEAKALFESLRVGEKDVSAINVIENIKEASTSPEVDCAQLHELHLDICRGEIKRIIENQYDIQLDTATLPEGFTDMTRPGAVSRVRGKKAVAIGGGMIATTPAMRAAGQAMAAEARAATSQGLRGLSAGAPRQIVQAGRTAAQAAPAATGLARVARVGGPVLAVAGAGLEGYNVFQEEKREGNSNGHSLAVGTTAAAGVLGGAWVGLQVGAAIGSVIPGAGTAVGAVAGFLVGAACVGVCSWLGGKVGRSVGDGVCSLNRDSVVGGLKSAGRWLAS